MTKDSDEELILRARSGEEGAFSALYERHKGTVFRFARRMLGDHGLAGDVVQETFEYFFRKIPEYRFEAKLTTLLLKAARNRSLNIIEKRRRSASVPLDDVGEQTNGSAEQPAEAAEKKDLSRQACEALETLEPMYREVVVLKILKGLSYERIGEILECPEGTVKSRLHNALGMLRKKMKFR
jgi:RNA polymerase sigma-70 factor (ECF subfamily)